MRKEEGIEMGRRKGRGGEGGRERGGGGGRERGEGREVERWGRRERGGGGEGRVMGGVERDDEEE